MKAWTIVLLVLFTSCKSTHNYYKEEHEDNFNLKQSKDIIDKNSKNKKANDRYAKKRQQKIQESANEKNQRSSKTKQPAREKGAVPH